MCTAISWYPDTGYFGRTLDYDRIYPFKPLMAPRFYPHNFRCGDSPARSYAMLGMGITLDGEPLFFDAVNEKGVYAAGLLFEGNAVYRRPLAGMDNVPSFAVIPWLLSRCQNLEEVQKALTRMNITDTPVREDLPPSPLHWFIADGTHSLTVEAAAAGLTVYDNPAGVLTNNPPFPQQMFHLSRYMGLSAMPPENRFAPAICFTPYSRGMGALGLPGDGTSSSRFVRTAFIKHNMVPGVTETENVNHMFHILSAAAQQKGSIRLADGGISYTQYTACADGTRGIYYYTTERNHRITAIDMYRADIDAASLIGFPLTDEEDIFYRNGGPGGHFLTRTRG